MGDEDISTADVTQEEIKNYERNHDEPHPVFQVEHRPERSAFTSFDGEDAEDAED